MYPAEISIYWSSLTTDRSQVTVVWPKTSKKRIEAFLEHRLKRTHAAGRKFSFPLLLSPVASWNINVMAGTPRATLNREVTFTMEATCWVEQNAPIGP